MKTFLCLLLTGLAASAQTQPFEVAEASIAAEQKAMQEGRTTSQALVQAYLKRIEAFDQKGPKLNAIITLNPNALKEAAALDRERATKGPRGPLHGIPVVVKDNYSTVDMPTTAGTLALYGFIPSSDAFQVRKLREVGAVIIGKTNLHELASGITTISSAGGQTLNPYDPTRTPGGSSGGTAAAVAASFAAIGMGSDTCGSIRIPSSHNNLVGLRPTKGISSIAGIVPLSTTQDVGGPLARTVEDLATVLDATLGEDPADAATHLAPGQARPNFTATFRTGSLATARLGTLEPLFGDTDEDQDVIRVVRGAVEEMKKAGATVVAVPLPELTAALEGNSLIAAEFPGDLADYLAHSGNPPVHSLKDIVDSGLVHVSLDTTFRRYLEGKGRDSDDYRKAMAKRAALAELIRKVMDEQKLDALVYPTMKRRPVHVGDPQPGSNCQMSASTGFPAISMQAGFTPDGLPVGIELFGRAFDDAKLVALAYAWEQATHHRRAPALTPALGSRTTPPLLTWRATGAGVTADYTFNPATGELKYSVTGAGLAAAFHRKGAGDIGPVFALLANHPFEKLAGSETLSNADRDNLLAGKLYLELTTKTPNPPVRLPVKPAAQP